MYQDGKTVDMNKTYKITFKAKADETKSIELGVEDPADGYASLKDEAVVWELTTEWVTYEYIFNPSASLGTVKYVLLIGNITGTDPNTKVYIDDFEVTQLEDSYPEINGVDNIEVIQGSGFTLLHGVTATDFEDGDITVNIIITGSFDNDAVGSYDIDYEITDSFGTTVIETRTITVVLEATEDYDVYNGDFSYGE